MKESVSQKRSCVSVSKCLSRFLREREKRREGAGGRENVCFSMSVSVCMCRCVARPKHWYQDVCYWSTGVCLCLCLCPCVYLFLCRCVVCVEEREWGGKGERVCVTLCVCMYVCVCVCAHVWQAKGPHREGRGTQAQYKSLWAGLWKSSNDFKWKVWWMSYTVDTSLATVFFCKHLACPSRTLGGA